MEKCKNCGKTLILSGGKCLNCQGSPKASNNQGRNEPFPSGKGRQPNWQEQPPRTEPNRQEQSYHDIMVFYRMDGLAMASQINNGLRELGYDCVLMEIDNDFASKDDEFRMVWKVQLNHCKDFFIVITADMANAWLNPRSDVHYLLRYLLPQKSGFERVKDNVHIYVEQNYLPVLDENVFEQIRGQLDREGYYSDVLGSTFIYPLKILRFDKGTGQYAVQGIADRLNGKRKAL